MEGQESTHSGPKPQPDKEPGPGDGRPLRVLLVEDNAAVASSMAAWLRQGGLDVEVALDGPSALAAEEKRPAQVVLLDLGLPGLDGFEVAQRIRAKRPRQRPLLIAVTGRDNDADRLRAYEAGIDLHLSKPVAAEELLYFVERFQANTPPPTQ